MYKVIEPFQTATCTEESTFHRESETVIVTKDQY